MEGQSSVKMARLMSNDGDETDEQQRRLETCLQQVLTNALVCEKIASYLTLSDMKAASEVNCQFLQAIRGTRRFAQTAVLAITDNNLEDMKTILMKTEYKWRGVKVDVTDPTNILEDLRHVLKSAEFVLLEGRPWMIEDRAVKDATAVSLLTAVLSFTPNLSQLKIDICILLLNVGGVLSSPAVQQTLRNLNRLDLVRMTEFESGWGHPQDFLNSEGKDTFWRNFGFLTGLPNRLKRFKLTSSTPIEQRNDRLNYFLRRLLMKNKATLEKLELHLRVWWIQELETLTFPALKALNACVELGGDTLGEFLKNQRSLEELTLTSWLVHGDYLNLYTGIKECSVGLKKLHLTGRNFAQFDWSFLAAMNRLKDFRLRMRGGFEKGDRLLASLPKNQLECLSLEGLWDNSDRPSGFWRLCGVENELQVKTELLQGLQCLRTLSFFGCVNAVDDELMQWLLKEFVSLEEFKLSQCSMLTDAGISGKTTADWGRGVSFADLRRLKTLQIVKCRGVTPNGILASCVNAPSLKSLEYTNPRGKIVESVVLKLVEQNPRLERLSLAYVGDVRDFGALKAKVKKKYPRVDLSLAEEDDDE